MTDYVNGSGGRRSFFGAKVAMGGPKETRLLQITPDCTCLTCNGTAWSLGWAKKLEMVLSPRRGAHVHRKAGVQIKRMYFW